ncbi:MAG TPA: hypothetical protein VMO26_21095 [Vicinamibacterales bacterium]|nr:hypothetical protein [Vicinamibacterales bacterium]
MLLSALMLCVVIVPLAAGALQAPPETTSRPDASGLRTAYALVVAHADRQLGFVFHRSGRTHARRCFTGKRCGARTSPSTVAAGSCS